ncbi:MAG: RNase adapter RapZ [Myxococcales bacterium]|nr:RNase adapter RapZ [Myxococcales bacterium]
MSLAPEKHIVVITGMSGSGKSTAIRALEDAGFFCIDNLPVVLLPKLTELLGLGGGSPRLALVIDVREGSFLADAPRMLEEARRAGHKVEVLFLDSSDDSLLRRFSETRRRHPLAPKGSVAEGISKERAALKDLRELADEVIDSSVLNVHDLKRLVQARFSSEPATAPSISVMSFGYRYGVPPQADLVLDVRFLPNPYFVPELKGLNGRDPMVASFVLGRADTEEFLCRVVQLCEFLFPRYQKEGKAYLTVALGCTGGKHRSVAIAGELHRRLAKLVPMVQLWNRDVEKE